MKSKLLFELAKFVAASPFILIAVIVGGLKMVIVLMCIITADRIMRIDNSDVNP